MQITCPRCLAAYDVPAAAFSGSGRKARCSSCHFLWVALPDGVDAAGATPSQAAPSLRTSAPKVAPPSASSSSAPFAPPPPEPVKDDPFAAMLSETEAEFEPAADDSSGYVARAARPQDTAPKPLSDADAAALARAASTLGEGPAVKKTAGRKTTPAAKKERGPLPSWLYAAGGVLVFVMVVLFLVRVPLGKSSPVMLSFYETLGFTIETPADLFSFTGINAVREDQGDVVVFTVTGRVTNISKRIHELPKIRVMWLTPKGTVGPYAITDAEKTTLSPSETARFTAQLKGVDTRAGGSVKVVFLDPSTVLPNSPPPVQVKKKPAPEAASSESSHPATASAPDAVSPHHSAETPQETGASHEAMVHAPAEPPINESHSAEAAPEPSSHEMPASEPPSEPETLPAEEDTAAHHDTPPPETEAPAHETAPSHSH